MALCAACAHGAPPGLPSLEPVADVPIAVPNLTLPPAREELDDVPTARSLSLRERAAQLIMPWIGGEYWAADEDAMATALHLAADEGVGGFVVGLGGSAYDLAAKFNALQRAAKFPLLIAADLESGPSARIRGGTAFPGNMALGASGREQDAYDVGGVIALEGRAVGIHLVFAPVVDVNNNPANPIINIRSFGEDPARVGVLASAFIRGLREHGMMGTAKHFPGHGDTGTDSHIALPVISAGRARLDSVELVPFRSALSAGVDAVMSAHIAMPGLTGGSDLPATLSGAVLDTLLRGDLRFRGLVVTDALNMGAIVARYGAAQSAVMALKAGADILLMPTDARQAIDAVVAAVERAEVSEARLDSSVARVLAAKARAGLFRRRLADLGAIPRVVGIRAHEDLARQVTQRTIVLVRDSLNLVPLSAERRRRALVIAYGDENSGNVGSAFAAALRARGVERVQTLRLWPASGPASYDSARTAATQASAVFVLVVARPAAWRPDAVTMPEALAQLVSQLAAAGTQLVTVALGSPYLLGQVPTTPGYLVAWTDNEVTERAAADAILGDAEITGRLPVALPPGYPRGAGLTRAGRPAAGPPSP
jgi:beta-N-acetylhexosaminidase